MRPRRNPLSFLPKRLQIVSGIFIFAILCIWVVGRSSHSEAIAPSLHKPAKGIVDAAHKGLEEINPWRNPVHKIPDQANSTSGEASWFADIKWRNPFSDKTTLDEDRAVLPPEKPRPTIYTYFDPREKGKEEKLLDAELELVNVWRRAWWAKGFKPMVLGPGEAMEHPMYEKMKAMKLAQDVEFEALRWLAWSKMGTGILCNWLAVPMSAYDDTLLDFLRRGDFTTLARFGDLGHGIFVGVKNDIDQATTSALSAENIKEVESFFDAFPKRALAVDREAASIAFYSGDNIGKKYSTIKQKFNEQSTMVEGLTDLAYLINSHLHTTWQNQFTGIYVVKPMAGQTTNMIQPAVEIARNLSSCSWSPLPQTCPPNIPDCRPCVATSPITISTPPVFRNNSEYYTIGTVPHPWTTNCLLHQREGLNAKFIRRQTVRDKWILEATKELLGTGESAYSRLSTFKDAVASDYSQPLTLWLTAETPFNAKEEQDDDELDWLFGFQLPRKLQSDGKGYGPVPGPERRPPPPKPEFGDVAQMSESDLAAERKRLQMSQQFIHAKTRKAQLENRELKDFVEAWNLADTEAWKFVRVFNARRSMERRTWEEEERAFLGQGLWDRLVDQFL